MILESSESTADGHRVAYPPRLQERLRRRREEERGGVGTHEGTKCQDRQTQWGKLQRQGSHKTVGCKTEEYKGVKCKRGQKKGGEKGKLKHSQQAASKFSMQNVPMPLKRIP